MKPVNLPTFGLLSIEDTLCEESRHSQRYERVMKGDLSTDFLLECVS